MPARALKAFLDENGVDYETLPHEATYTAQEAAAATHVPGKEVAKTVIVKVEGEMAMAVVRATDRVSVARLEEVTGGEVELAEEEEFRTRFPGVDPGAMPPFGNLYEMEVFVDQALRQDETIAFNAGSHTEMVRLAYADFERLVEPVVAEISVSE